MNETVWRDEPPAGDLVLDANALGTFLPTQSEWRALWADSELVDQAHESRDIAIGEEARSRITWIGWRWLLPAWGRAIRIAVTDCGGAQGVARADELPTVVGGAHGVRAVRGASRFRR